MIGPSYFTVRFDLCDWQCCRKVLSLISVKLVCEFKSFLFFYVLSFFACLLCLMSKLDNNFTVCEVLNIFFLHALSMITSASNNYPMREKCANTEVFLVRIFPYSDWIWRFTTEILVYSPNTDQKKLLIWEVFTQSQVAVSILMLISIY